MTSTTWSSVRESRRWTWPKLVTTKMWSSLLYLSILLYLVQPSHGYFYKGSQVSDNEKQCFCEVSNPKNKSIVIATLDRRRVYVISATNR